MEITVNGKYSLGLLNSNGYIASVYCNPESALSIKWAIRILKDKAITAKADFLLITVNHVNKRERLV